MILIFLGSWRSTLIIAVSIPPDSELYPVLSFLHETINVMTLGGRALAVGILVDDATVETRMSIAISIAGCGSASNSVGAQQIAVPALVSTPASRLFIPMFSGTASTPFIRPTARRWFRHDGLLVLSRTLVPTLALYLLRTGSPHATRRGTSASSSAPQRVSQTSARVRTLLTTLVYRRKIFIPALLDLRFCILPDTPARPGFLPATDSGQPCFMRFKTGTRIEETAAVHLVEGSIRRRFRPEPDNVLDNIGLPYSISTSSTPPGLIGSALRLFVSFKEKHRPVQEYARVVRGKLAREFPGTTFYFLPADMISQILNFGSPAPIDVQIEGANLDADRQLANSLLGQLRHVPGVADLHIQQDFDYPRFHLEIDRTKAAQGGFTPRDIANSLLVSLSGSFQTTPSFFLNRQNGVEYNLVTQTPQYATQSLEDVQNLPISSPGMVHPEILADISSLTRTTEPDVLSHYNIRRVVDIYGSVDGRDLGAVGRDVERIVEANRKSVPRGSFVAVKGQVETMRTHIRGC